VADWDDDTKITTKSDNPPPGEEPHAARAYLIVLAGSNVGEMYKIHEGETIIGRGTQAEIKVIDEGISRTHARIVHDAGDLYVEDLDSKNGTYANGQRVRRHKLSDGDKIQVGETTILKFTYHDKLDENFQRQMYESALRDGLTKVFNKKYFIDRLEAEFAYAVRHRTPLSLVMFDIDHFKRINDQHGHLAGDYTLQSLAQAVSQTIRAEDVFARYGGEEFSVICRGVDLQGAARFAERVRGIIETITFSYQGTRLPITISLGVAGLPDPALREPIDLISAADAALYQAKNGGRNRVVLHGPR
jgi:diguanylate cyclase (GGDEF)-like protein